MAIEIRVDNVSQLFNTLDPFPFPERDLDKDAEELLPPGRENFHPLSRSKLLFSSRQMNCPNIAW
jgi:hypothetical protein